jgi:aryl-alcohol dehydrogenase-like predicted oxidoreductase
MEYLKIAGLPLEASRIALGTWAIGGWMWGGTEESDAISTIHAAVCTENLNADVVVMKSA